MIITVARECGSGGHAIGSALAEYYGIKCYDRHILVAEAKKQGKYEELESFFSEKPMDSLLYSIAVNHGKNRNNAILEKFEALITEESFVLIGRCGNYLYGNRPDCTTLFVHGDTENKIQRTIRKQNIDRIKALELIQFVDSKRQSFHRHYTGQDWADARNYQLTVNSSILGVEETAAEIIHFIGRK